MSIHWYYGLCCLCDRPAHADNVMMAHIRIQRMAPISSIKRLQIICVCLPRTFQQTFRNSPSCGTGMFIHVLAAIYNCRSLHPLAHPTSQDVSWLIMACLNGTGCARSFLPCHHSDFLSIRTLPVLLLFAFFSPFNRLSRARYQETSIAAQKARKLQPRV